MKKIVVVGEMEGYDLANRVYDVHGISPTIRTFGGGGLEPKIVCSCAFRGRQNGNSMQQKLEVSEKK